MILQERQRLSFLLVVIFLALFGLIVLAEVLFVDNYEEHNWIDVDDFNDDDGSDLLRWISTSVGSGGANGGGGAEKKRQRFNLRQREMEMLISNISEGMKTALPAFRNKKLPPKPYNYAADEFLPEGAFDFSADGGGLGRGVDAQWQPVAGTMDKFYVYSAYLDARKGGRKGGGGGHNIVRIIGVARTKFPDKVACRLWWNGGRQKDGDGQGDQPPRPSLPRRVPATVTVIRENWNLRYSAVFVLCPLPDVAGHPLPPPAAVSVIAAGWSKASAATNQLPVLNADVDLADAERRLAASDAVGVCVKPFHFNYSRTVDLIEFIELNRILGVRGFTFYNDTLSEESGCVLRHYNRTASIELHPWRLNMGSQTEIRTEGLFAALNDCLYRNMYAFNYLLLIDLDEFVVPQTNLSSLAQMLRSVDAAKSATLARRGHKDTSAARVTASYSFQNSFFYLQFPDDPGNGDEDRLWTRYSHDFSIPHLSFDPRGWVEGLTGNPPPTPTPCQV